MVFVPKDWRDLPDQTTPITAVALEDLETRVYSAAVADGRPNGLVYLSDYTSTLDGSADVTTAFQAALDAARAVDGELIVDGIARIDGTITNSTGDNAGRGQVTIRGLGARWSGANSSINNVTGSVVVDHNSTGPWLRITGSGVGNSSFKVTLRDFDIKLGVSKPDDSMVELVLGQTGNSIIDNVSVWGDNSVNYYPVLSAFWIENTWNGRMSNCLFHHLMGHSVWMDNNSGLNGGNWHFDSCEENDVTSGMWVEGSGTTNNLTFTNCKWYGGLVASTYSFYEARTTSLPASGATTIQLQTGLSSANYFPPNAAVVLHSDAGTEVVHCAATGTAYNSGTGVLTLQDATSLNHSAQSDMRVICAPFAIATGFFTPVFLFDGCHFERTQLCLIDGSGTFVASHFATVQHPNDDIGRSVIVGGTSVGTYHFIGSRWVNQEIPTDCRLVFGMMLTGKSVGAAVDIDQINTYPRALADQTSAKWRPLGGDSLWLSLANYRVRTEKFGTQINTIDAPVADRQRTNNQIFTNFNRIGPNVINTVPAATAGTLRLYLIWLPAGYPVASITFCSGGTGLTTSGTGPHSWVALYDSSRVLLRQSTDVTNLAWSANVTKKFALASIYLTTYEGFYYLGLMIHCGSTGTMPTLTGVNHATQNLLDVAPLPGGNTASTGLGATAPDPAGAITQGTNIAWCGVADTT